MHLINLQNKYKYKLEEHFSFEIYSKDKFSTYKCNQLEGIYNRKTATVYIIMSYFFLDYKSFSAICIIGKMTNASVSFKHSKYCKHQSISSNLDEKHIYTDYTNACGRTHTHNHKLSPV